MCCLGFPPGFQAVHILVKESKCMGWSSNSGRRPGIGQLDPSCIGLTHLPGLQSKALWSAVDALGFIRSIANGTFNNSSIGGLLILFIFFFIFLCFYILSDYCYMTIIFALVTLLITLLVTTITTLYEGGGIARLVSCPTLKLGTRVQIPVGAWLGSPNTWMRGEEIANCKSHIASVSLTSCVFTYHGGSVRSVTGITLGLRDKDLLHLTLSLHRLPAK